MKVVDRDFKDAALVLVGHGSTVDPDSGAPVYQHATELRRRKIFAEVLECFWKQEPKIREVMAAVRSQRVFIVPIFISEGYFTQEAIPREFGLRDPRQAGWGVAEQMGAKTLFYCAPIGTHESMTEVLLARAREVVEQHPFPRAPKPEEIALFIAGHGTERNENSRLAIERQVECLRSRNEYAGIYPAFIEEEPRIEACYETAQVKNIVLVPFFTSDGMHVRQDIPVLLGESKQKVQERLQNGQPIWRNPTERKGKRLWYSASVGTEPRIADVIMERVFASAQAGTAEQ